MNALAPDVFSVSKDKSEGSSQQMATFRAAVLRAERERLAGAPCLTGEEILAWLKSRC